VKELPSREQAIRLLFENGCSVKVINHCKAVSKLALETANILKKKGLKVDADLVEIGALLHDIGRSKTHTVHHAIVGAEIARTAGLPESVVSVIERHVGGGITPSEAHALGWSEGIYAPVSDKLIEKGQRVPIEVTFEKLCREHLCEAAERVRRLNEEIAGLTGDCS
jgi:uncharacterized protein